ncbi:hypothetical protein SAMN04515666_102598 [Bosea lupini]|jgi:hypothetical protein|uniref:Uncharacterized protein n=1 Tax=Bosea lupini TaxID=1036779 RepID=A0A1H7LS69_9HYPH|nr:MULTISPECIES: hypothetical protein [Bosea]SEL01217.1 hypothetical protein SAMN04515666_102598 [Bosea lupini]
MLRKLFLGLSAAAALGAASLGVSAITAAPADAQALSGGYGYPGSGSRHPSAPRYSNPGWGGGPHVRPRPGYGRPHYGQRCRIVDQRVWNGRRYVIRSTRVCR